MERLNPLKIVEIARETGKQALQNLIDRIEINMDDRLDVWSDDE